MDRNKHWEGIYESKQLKEVSWYQPKPQSSLELIQGFDGDKTAKIIDVGGGDSLLVDHLLAEGYADLTVLDISSKAIDRAQARLGGKANQVKWIVSDAVDFSPSEKYDLWHDRAAFHFLSDSKDIEQYVKIAHAALNTGGKMVVGTFSTNGPTKCSGIEVKQYDAGSMKQTFEQYFSPIDCSIHQHETPSKKVQEFIFCGFERK
jgi:2-polyprenyl-3-methyl-5-hydroxy-6-metoxy-1,4-benzoquinol methylase